MNSRDRVESVYGRVADFAVQHRRAILVVAFLLLPLSGFISSRLELDPDILNLVPRHNREVNEFRHVIGRLGTIDQHVVVLEFPRESEIETYGPLIDDVAEGLRNAGSIRSVDASLPSAVTLAEELTPHALLYLKPEELPLVEAKLTDQQIRESVQQNATLLQTPQGSTMEPLIRWDPFRLLPLFAGKLTPQSGGMKIDAASGYILSADHSMALVIARPDRSAQDIPFATELLQKSSRIAADAVARWRRDNPEAAMPRIGFAGGYAIAVNDAKLIRKDILLNVTMSITGVLLLFIYAFRGVSSIAIAGLPMMLSIAVTFALATVTFGRLSSASALFGALVAGLGIDFITVTYERYLYERGSGRDVTAALRMMMKKTMPGVVIAAITTAGTFFAYLATDYKGMSELGFLTGSGIIVFLLCVMLVIPALVAALDLRRTSYRPMTLHSFGTSHLITYAVARPGRVIAAWLLIIAVCAFFARGIRFDPEISSFRSKDNAAARLQERVTKTFGQSFSAMMYVVERPTLEAAINDAARANASLDRLVKEGAIGSYQSIGTILPPTDQQLAVIAAARAKRSSTLSLERIRASFDAALVEAGFKPEAYEEYFPLFARMLSPERPVTFIDLEKSAVGPFLQRFVRKTADGYMAVTYLYPKGGAWPSEVPRELMTWRASERGGIVTGVNLVSMRLRQIIQRDAMRSTIWGFVAIFVLFILFHRSVSRAALMFVPLIAGSAGMIGCMALLGLQFNLVNAFVGLMLVGVATDYAIYIAQRYYEDPAAFVEAAPDTAKAVVMAALTSMVGFGSFVTSHFPGMRSIGYASLFGIAFSCLASITLLPAILMKRQRSLD